MGNQCFRDTTAHDHETPDSSTVKLEEHKKKRQPSSIGGVYYQQLQADRQHIVDSKQARNKQDRIKLEQLRKNLQQFEATSDGTKQYEFKHKRYVAEIETLERIIKTREDQIMNIKQGSAR